MQHVESAVIVALHTGGITSVHQERRRAVQAAAVEKLARLLHFLLDAKRIPRFFHGFLVHAVLLGKKLLGFFRINNRATVAFFVESFKSGFFKSLHIQAKRFGGIEKLTANRPLRAGHGWHFDYRDILRLLLLHPGFKRLVQRVTVRTTEPEKFGNGRLLNLHDLRRQSGVILPFQIFHLRLGGKRQRSGCHECEKNFFHIPFLKKNQQQKCRGNSIEKHGKKRFTRM